VTVAERASRIVLKTSSEQIERLGARAKEMGLSKTAAVRLAVSLLLDVAEELDRGAKLTLQSPGEESCEIRYLQISGGGRKASE